MFNKTHRCTVAVHIPNSIPPDAVVQALHKHTPLLDLLPIVDSYTEIPIASLPERVQNDVEHFAQHLSRSEIVAYDIIDKIHLVPGVTSTWATKVVRYSGRFQDLPNGVKTTANAPAGVVTRGEYRVEFRDSLDQSGEGEHDRRNESGWWLVEETSVECSALMMPLVAWNLDSSHREMLERLLEHLQKEHGDGNWEDKPPAPPPKD